MSIMATHPQSPTYASEEAVREVVCRCEKLSWTEKRGSRKPANVPITNMFLIILLSISSLTCCVSAWPTILNQRRNVHYNIPQPDYELVDPQWVMASEPEIYYDLPVQSVPDTFYDDAGYENPDDTLESMFGPFDQEPEAELELEQLKNEQPYVYTHQTSRKVNSLPTTKPPTKTATSTQTSTSSLSTSATPPPPHTVDIRSDSRKARVSPPSSPFDGQKEIAMLRPPAAKSHHIQIDEPEEPKISVAQRSPSNEKPSAYDTLRKYLSLDDALKKEFQQRRANGNRHAKRESSFITDSDSLTGQLNNLKKKLD